MTPRPKTPTAPRTRTASSQVRGALVDAAVRVLERDGHAGLTVRAVAAEAGVAPMGVYNHLDGKNGLLEAVLVSGFKGLTAAVTWNPAFPAEQAFFEVGRGYRRFALSRPVTYGLMFGGAVAPEIYERIGEHAAPAFETLLDTVRHCQAAGLLRDDDVQTLAMCIWSAVHGAVSLELGSGQPAETGDALYESVLQMINVGLAPH